MIYRFASVGLAMLLSVNTLTSILAQDDVADRDEAAAPAEKVIRPFAEVAAAWEATDKSIGDVIEKFRTALATDKPGLVEQYEDLIKKSRELMVELRIAALTAYEAAPNADDKVTSMMLVLLSNDLLDDRYTDALKLGDLLLKHKCEDPALDGLIGIAAYCLNDFAKAAVHLNKGKAAKALTAQAGTYLEDLDQATKSWARELELREVEAAADNLPHVKLQTSKGDLVIELLENEAPQAVANFISLVEREFYDGLTFHRVLAGFMAQGGCPNGTGTGGPGYKIYCECHQENHRRHFRGTLSMAHAGKDTGGSQFFLTFRRTAHLDGRHTVFGRVVEGLDVMQELQRRNPTGRGQPDPDKILKAEVLRKRDHEYAPTKVGLKKVDE
jgi:cyclophilin family peptidyl-prolyl cis-trans isomerase